MRRIVAVTAMAVGLAVCAAPAGAAITASQVTSPSNPTFLNPDIHAGAPPLPVSGTTSGGNPATDTVDIVCVYGAGADQGRVVLRNDVDVRADGTFETTVDPLDFWYLVCRLIAVPEATGGPFNTDTYKGSVVSNSGHYREPVRSGVNAGKLRDYFQASSALEGYFSALSAGNCYVGDSFPVDPPTFRWTHLFGCSSIPAGQAAELRSLRVDGRNVYLPFDADPSIAGYRGIEDVQLSIDGAAGGVMRVRATEPAVVCNDDVTCTAYQSAGLELHQQQNGGERGHTLAVDHRWVNTTGAPKQLAVTYRVVIAGFTSAWRFPGEAAYATHAAGDTVTPPSSGPGSVSVTTSAGGTCEAVSSACGSVTWNAPPQAIRFVRDDEVDLTYSRTIPAGGAALIAFEYAQDLSQAPVEGYAAAARARFAQTPPVIGHPVVVNPPVVNKPPAARDTRRPVLSKLKLKKGKRGRRVLTLSVSEPATIRVGVERAKGKRFTRVKSIRKQARRSGNVSIVIARKAPKPGRYRLKVSATDAAQNSSTARPLRFRVR